MKVSFTGVPVKKICKKSNSTAVKGLKILFLSMQYIFISPIDTEINYQHMIVFNNEINTVMSSHFY